MVCVRRHPLILALLTIQRSALQRDANGVAFDGDGLHSFGELMHGIVLLDLKRVEIEFGFDAEAAFEIFWYSPRVRASAASPKFKFTRGERCALLVENGEPRRFSLFSVQCGSISFAALAE